MPADRHRRLPLLSVLAACVAAALQVPLLSSQSPSPAGVQARVTIAGNQAVAGEVLVQFERAASPANYRVLEQQVDAQQNVPVGRGGLRRFRSRHFDVESLIAFFRAQPGVRFVEPNYIIHADAAPDDPRFPSLWGLLNTGQLIPGGTFGTPGGDIDATSAWDVSTGSRANVVGVVDSGFDYTHPDLGANVWSAPSPYTVTIGGVPITCPAGSHGFNAITKTCDPMDIDNHGTHVSGTIGAIGNNGVGVAGVNWTASIIAAKFLERSVGTTSDAIDAIDFMIQAKAAFAPTGGANIRALSNSWSGGAFSTALLDAITAANANDILFVASAGNNARNTDTEPAYPAGYDVPNVIAVGATDNNDLLASFSNYGTASVDLAAPGVSILSTIIGNRYAPLTGTSMAAPHVTGAAALVLSACTLDTAGLKAALLSTVDARPSLVGLVGTSGRLNVNSAIRSCGSPGVPSPPTGLAATAGDGQVMLTWGGAPGATSYRVKRAGISGGPYATVATGVTAKMYVDAGLTNEETYFYVVTAENALGESADSAELSATPSPGIPASPQDLTASPGDARALLAWSPAVWAQTYRVKRSLVRAGPYVLVAEVASTSYADTAVTNGTNYFYVVTALNHAGESTASNRDRVFPAPVPAQPTGVAALPGATPGTITVSWMPTPWAIRYRVKRSQAAGGPYSSRNVTSPTFVDDSRTSGKRYYYVISALNATGESGPSIEVSAVPK